VRPVPRAWLTGLLAAAVMAIVLVGTSNALRDSGPWAQARLRRHHPPIDPYERLNRLIADAGRDVLPSTIRDPFGYVTVTIASGPSRPLARPRVASVPEKPLPVLTAIVTTDGGDAQAVIDCEGHAHTVRVGSSFCGYQVISIGDSCVVIDGNGKQTTLCMGSKGK